MQLELPMRDGRVRSIDDSLSEFESDDRIGQKLLVNVESRLFSKSWLPGVARYPGVSAIASHKPTRGEQYLQRRSDQSQHRRPHVAKHSTWAIRRHSVAAALAPRLEGLNITTDLLQVRKVVTGQQL